ATLAKLPEDSLANLRHRIVRPRSFDLDDHWPEPIAWDSESIGQWTKLIRGDEEFDFLIELLSDIWSQFHFDIIATWGENGIVKRFAAQSGVTHVALELGCTRPPYA